MIKKITLLSAILLSLSASVDEITYFKVGWGYGGLNIMQTGATSISQKTEPFQNLEIGYDAKYLRLSTYIKFGKDTAPDDYVGKIGYKLGITTKNMFSMVFGNIQVVPIMTINSSYFYLDSSKTVSANAIGSSFTLDLHHKKYNFVSAFVEYEYEQSGVYDSAASSTNFYKVQEHIASIGFSVLF